MRRWFSQLSVRQRGWLWGTVVSIIIIIGAGIILNPVEKPGTADEFSVAMSIKDIAPRLNVTGKALARELDLPLDVSKRKPLGALGVTPEKLHHVTQHLLSHRDTALKYFVFAALVLGGLVFLTVLGRPDRSGMEHRREWYPRTVYIIFLALSVIFTGFLLGKSPNPMEGIVKVFKSMVGLYPDPWSKVLAFLFFIALAMVGNKMICGWACPFGALQELVYTIPILKGIKQKKLPFVVTNAIRAGLFAVMLLFLFGLIGGRKGTVIYHYVNPFNLFNQDFESFSILLTVILAILGSFLVYRPFCQLICPFGFGSWIAERFSLIRVQIDKNVCTECGACISACPLEAARGMINGRVFPADCYSCTRCLNVCPVDAITYASVFKKEKSGKSSNTIEMDDK